MSRRDRASRIVSDATALPRAFETARPASDPAEEAYRRGVAEGAARAAAEAEVRLAASLDEVRAELGRALVSLGDLRERLTRDHEERMIELALEAACAIVRERIEADDPVAARAVRDALDALPATEHATIRLHADDVPTVEKMLAESTTPGRLTLERDESIARGGCVVVTAGGTVDARLETATAAVREAAEGGDATP